MFPKVILIIAACMGGVGGSAFGEERGGDSDRPAKVAAAQYWDKGDVKLRLVQNLTFKKVNRLKVSALWGVSSLDPFLAIRQYGGTFAFYFLPSWALQAFYWRYAVSFSEAQSVLEEGAAHSTANTNAPRSMMGGELIYAPFFGKLSLLDIALVHHDIFFAAGLGKVQTEQGNYLAPQLGVGQHFFWGRWLAWGVDYRFSYYDETVRAPGGEEVNRRAVQHAFFLSLSVWLGASS